MRAPSIRGVGVVSAWGRGVSALPADARAASAGRRLLSCGRLGRDGERFRRATREGLLALAAVDMAIEDGGAGPEAIAGDRTALIYVTAAAYGPSNQRFIEGPGGSIHFAETAPAVAPAEVSIEFRVGGAYAIFIGGPPTTLRAIWHAAVLLDTAVCDRALVLAVEIFDECAELYARAGRLTGAPLVEAAGCLWLEPGAGELSLEAGGAETTATADTPRAGRALRGGDTLAGVRRQLGQTFSCEPVVALDLWRRTGAAGTLDITGRWRGDTARLVWTDAMARGASAA